MTPPATTLARLREHGSALWVVPVDPQPTQHVIEPERRARIAAEGPYRPGDVLTVNCPDCEALDRPLGCCGCSLCHGDGELFLRVATVGCKRVQELDGDDVHNWDANPWVWVIEITRNQTAAQGAEGGD